MTRKEFEIIAGVEVGEEEYNEVIEPMYLASGLDKYEFIKYINKSMFEKKKIKVDLPIGEIEGEPMALFYFFVCLERLKELEPSNPVIRDNKDEVLGKLYGALEKGGFFNSLRSGLK